MNQYSVLKDRHTKDYSRLKKGYNFISILRLCSVIIFLTCFYAFLKTTNSFFIVIFLFSLISFLALIRIHLKLEWEIKIKQALIDINEDEINYLSKNEIPFDDGSEYINTSHPYSFDLDIFGKHSLYHHLNRTASYIGQRTLAEFLLTLFPQKDILENQEAIKELAPKVSWRQDIHAIAKTTNDSQGIYNKLISWAKSGTVQLTNTIRTIAVILPVLFSVCFISWIIFDYEMMGRVAGYLFFLNLLVLFSQQKKIKEELIQADKVNKIIKQYSLILERIEIEKFESKKLNDLKSKLIYKTGAVSIQVKKLAALFASLDSIKNPLGTFLFNGTFLYHLHILHSFLKWKKEFAHLIPGWLEVIGDFETLNSMANVSYNNPGFTFPRLNDHFQISFNKLGHPLIDAEKRICNTVDFNSHRFIILTGSNMSGKSTFLRTLGINMILAGIGSPVCASNANIHPLPVLVSMRISDSLTEGESYFFTEVKRLKEIVNALNSKVCFVLLDEILRGTNSDDKRTGTIEVIRKMIEKSAIGSIATHDLEICHTTDEYPGSLVNKCFEVEIINNDLSFDYKLRDGICKNKSATFLMRKMEII